MDDDQEQLTQMRRDVTRLRVQVHDLRLLALRLPVVLALALIVVGSVMPAWSETIEDEAFTARVATAGFQAFAASDDDRAVVIGIGFLGLLVVLLLLCGVLVNSILAGQGRSERERCAV